MRETGLFDLVSCFDFNEQAMAAAERDDGAKPAESFEALLDTPGIEALIVSTGGKYHAEQVLAALDRGLHVFVEKPLCSTPEEMHALLAKTHETGLVAACGHMDHSTEKTSLAIKALLDSGDMGAVASFEATTAHSGAHMIKPGDWRGDPEKNPGGMLFQCGCHKLHELMYYFGPVSRVQAAMRYDVLSTTGTADTAHCILEFASGIMGTLNAYHVSPYEHTLRIYGTKMNVHRDDRYGDEGIRLETQTTQLDGKYEPRVPLSTPATTDACGNVRSFYEAVRHGSPVYPSLVDGARAVAVVFAAEEAAKTGRAVDVPPLDA
jgi:predicted dehydrogenase